jgi:hypothetical protein
MRGSTLVSSSLAQKYKNRMEVTDRKNTLAYYDTEKYCHKKFYGTVACSKNTFSIHNCCCTVKS